MRLSSVCLKGAQEGGVNEMTAIAEMAVRAVRPAGTPEAAVGLDKKEFAALYEETFAAVLRYAHVLTGNVSLAEDVAAEVYLRAWQYRRSFRADGTPLSWLLSITHNCAVRVGARAAREVTGPDGVAAHVGTAVDFDSLMEAGTQQERLLLAIHSLTPSQQRVIFLRFFADWTHAQVAEALGRDERAIRALQYRALRRLRVLLERLDAS